MSEDEIIDTITKQLKRKADYDTGVHLPQLAVEGLLDLYAQEKEKNKKLSQCHLQYEEMTGVDLLLPDKLSVISKDKIIEILGLEKETTEQTVLQYIKTLVSENARLEDIEDF